MRTLVTGFGPFLSNDENPSAWLAETSNHPNVVLEVSYKAVTNFIETLDPSSFDRLLMIGLKGSGRKMLLESRARNLIGTTPDVRGHVPDSRTILPSGAKLLPATLWSEGHRVDARIGTSTNAGGYLCNFILYTALARFPDKRIGFLHVPPFRRIPREIQRDILARLLAADVGSPY